MLKAKKFSDEKFQITGGYFMETNNWGVINTETGGWVAFSGTLYVPQGGRKGAKLVADTCDASELEYIFPMA